MSLIQYFFAIACAIFTLALVVWLLRKGRLRERHAIWWIIGGLLALITSVFPATLQWATHLLGFNLGANLVYFVSIALLVLVCIQHSSELTKIESQVRSMAEELAILRMNLDHAKAESEKPSSGAQPSNDATVSKGR